MTFQVESRFNRTKKVDPPILTALQRLGYGKVEVRNDALSARRGADHLIIKLTKKGKVKGVSAHRDTLGRSLPFAYKHRAVKGEVASKLAKEFTALYRELGKLHRSVEFEQFLRLCRDADDLLTSLKHNPKLQGKKPRSLKAATIHYLARKRGIPVTLHHLYLIYGCMQQTVIRLERIIKEEAEKRQ